LPAHFQPIFWKATENDASLSIYKLIMIWTIPNC
jgi:hypothetical protein